MQVAVSLLAAPAAAWALPAHAISSEAVATMAASKLPGDAHLRPAHGRSESPTHIGAR